MFQFISVRIARSWAGALRAVTSDALQAVQRLQQRLERAWGQRSRRVVRLVCLKCIETVLMEHAFSFVGEDDGVAVEGDPHFGWMRIFARCLRVDERGRKPGIESCADILAVRR